METITATTTKFGCNGNAMAMTAMDGVMATRRQQRQWAARWRRQWAAQQRRQLKTQRQWQWQQRIVNATATTTMAMDSANNSDGNEMRNGDMTGTERHDGNGKRWRVGDATTTEVTTATQW